MIIIGMAGAAGAGKDTAAQYLVARHGFHQIAFATPFKRAVGRILDMDDDTLEAHKDVPVPWLDLTPRALLQTIGTECGRALSPDIWVRFASREIERLRGAGVDRIVISDVRHTNEATLVRLLDGLVLRVERTVMRQVRPHSTETPLPAEYVHYTLQNQSTPAVLHSQLDRVLADCGLVDAAEVAL